MGSLWGSKVNVTQEGTSRAGDTGGCPSDYLRGFNDVTVAGRRTKKKQTIHVTLILNFELEILRKNDQLFVSYLSMTQLQLKRPSRKIKKNFTKKLCMGCDT